MEENVRDQREAHDWVVPGDQHTDRPGNVHDLEDISVPVHIYLEDSYLEILVELVDQNGDNDLFLVSDTQHQHLVAEVSYHVGVSQVFLDDTDDERTHVTDDDSVHDKWVHHGPLTADDNQNS